MKIIVKGGEAVCDNCGNFELRTQPIHYDTYIPYFDDDKGTIQIKCEGYDTIKDKRQLFCSRCKEKVENSDDFNNWQINK